MIAIVDYGLGNLGSVKNMLEKIGCESVITSDEETINKSQKLILPGVGSFDKGINNLKERGLFGVLNRYSAVLKKPVLGICLGMQLMFEKSEEGEEKGLGWIAGHVRRFSQEYNSTRLKIPHMGWNIGIPQRESPLMTGLSEIEQRYYFVHSYYVLCGSEENILMKTNYGISFASAVQKDNLYGVQFHPEKSHKFGMKILGNFCFRA